MADKDFEWPWQYNFPPFFTLQPNLATRKKQFEAWKNLVLEYHKVLKHYSLDITEAQSSPLFFNKSINRKVPVDVIYMILEELAAQGNVEWIDRSKQRCYIYWRTPEEWGKLIYKWASDTGMTNSVCTLFELSDGDDTESEEFHGLDNGVLKKALICLEKEGLAEVMIDGDSEDSALIRLLPSAYEDGVQKAVKQKKEANPFTISDALMKMSTHCKDCRTQCSKTGKNVLMVFFGQFVVEEILNSRRPSCPQEYLNIEILPSHDFSSLNVSDMPFVRTQYDKISGLSPNNPRQQLNSATSWIDGSVIYGTTKAKAASLRSFKDGQLASSDKDGKFPSYNENYLQFLNPTFRKEKGKKDAESHKSVNFKIGNPLGHENPFVLTFNVVFFRWHNVLAKTFCGQNKDWNDEYCFNAARKWVIATLQNVVVNEWLPELLGGKLNNYTRYDPSIHPGISHAFQSAAMRYAQILVPAFVYKWKPTGECEQTVLRMCNSYYNAVDELLEGGVESLLLGMAFQAAEVEDLIAVNDIRKYLYGPLEFPRRDLMAMNIQRGRDHGLPGYGKAKKFMLPLDTPHNYTFEAMADHCDPAYRHIIEDVLPQFYESVYDIDLWIGGLLESDRGPGPVFKEIIREQFERIRDGDRFWFQNYENGLFTRDEIQRIESTRMYDILTAVDNTKNLEKLQLEVFHLPEEEETKILDKCAKKLQSYPCTLSDKNTNCFSLPPLREECVEKLESCSNSKLETYDYFEGSGALFILSFLFLFLYIIGCIVTLLGMVRKRQRIAASKTLAAKHHGVRSSDANSHVVTEWVDKKEGTRQVIVSFEAARKHLVVRQLNRAALRSIDLTNVQKVELHVSIAGNEQFLLVRIPVEYDMVLKFDSDIEKVSFVDRLETFLGSVGVGRQRYEKSVPQMLKEAFTKADRQVQLEKFFRVVFAQAFSIEHDQHEQVNLGGKNARDIINTELTPYEFAEALSLKPDALFVKQMFDLIDADGNGYISFREFLNVIVIFAKGSPEEKTKLLFDMYDVDHSGKLTRQEFSIMIRSLVELANQSLSSDQMDHLVTSMFKSAGLQNKPEITFEDFSHLLSEHREELGGIQLSFDVGEGYKAGPATKSKNRQSLAMRAEETVRAYSIYGTSRDLRRERAKSHIKVETKTMLPENTATKRRVNKVIRFIENYSLHIFWTVIYTILLFGIFIEKAYYYSVESEHTGIRRIAGYGLTITRGAASAMMFAYSTILLTMCRNTITFLRETFVHKYFPFDIAIPFHKYIAFWGLIFTIIHAVGHALNFYHASTQTPSTIQCLFRDFDIDLDHPPKFHFWLLQTVTGTTGVALVQIISLMYVFALQYSRRHVFNAFWTTHNLYPLLYILMILHGLGRVIQDPIFHYFFVAPCVLFTIDRLISISRKKVEIAVIKAELLPSGVTHLEIRRPANFEYRSGQWVRIACVPLNSNEYHPFTLSSAPHEENLSLHIRAVGPWTANLREIYDPNNLQQHAYPKVYLDGPYGEGHQDWFRYDVSVLVGGGIGITPFASILKDIVFKSNVKVKISCKKLYFIWVTRTQKHFEWMTDIIREVENSDTQGLVDVHIFITQFYQKFDLRTTMLYICERHFQRVSGRSLFTGLQSTTHFGRPDFKQFFNSLQEEHPDVNKIAVFSCGPPQMTRGVQLSCDELNKHDGAIFVHHFENF